MTLSKVERAVEFALRCHAGQVDKGGCSYIFHVICVADAIACRGLGDDATVAAVLHDVVEDCGVSLDVLRSRFGDGVADIVSVISRQLGEDYLEYVRRVSRNYTATQIKKQDLYQNLRSDRILPDPDREMCKRYRKALAILEGIVQ